jgi:hypothetical protein
MIVGGKKGNLLSLIKNAVPNTEGYIRWDRTIIVLTLTWHL